MLERRISGGLEIILWRLLVGSVCICCGYRGHRMSARCVAWLVGLGGCLYRFWDGGT